MQIVTANDPFIHRLTFHGVQYARGYAAEDIQFELVARLRKGDRPTVSIRIRNPKKLIGHSVKLLTFEDGFPTEGLNALAASGELIHALVQKDGGVASYSDLLSVVAANVAQLDIKAVGDDEIRFVLRIGTFCTELTLREYRVKGFLSVIKPDA